MPRAAEAIKIPLKQKLKTLLKASTRATCYSSVAFVMILLLATLYNEEKLTDFSVTAEAIIIFCIALQLIWLTGMILLGLPVWIISEKFGWHKKWLAQLLGAVLPAAFGLWTEYNVNIMQPWKVMLPIALFCIGGLIGTYIWKRHYKPLENAMPVSEAAH